MTAMAKIKRDDALVRGHRGRWPPGKSGNPAGRKAGSRNRCHVLLQEVVARDAERVVERVIACALAGDMRAAQLILDRALPKRVCRPVPSLELPEIRTAEDAVIAMGAIARAALAGEISTSEAAELSQVVESFRKVLEASEFERRLRDVEERLAQGDDEA